MTVISSNIAESYEASGFVHSRGLVSGPELSRLQTVTDQIIDFASVYHVPDPDYRYRTDSSTGDRVFFRINNVKVRCVEFQALFGHPGLLGMFRDLIGPNFIMIDDALVVKVARGGTDFPWHRDVAAYARLAGDSLVVPGIDLDVSNDENGCLHVVPGSHRDSAADLSELTSKYGFDIPGAVSIHSSTGDVCVHSGNLLHGSKPNRSATSRRTIYVAAMDIDDYLASYEPTPELVLMQMRYMARGIQLRRSLPYLEGEREYTWTGDHRWRVDLDESDYVDWGLPAAPRRARAV